MDPDYEAYGGGKSRDPVSTACTDEQHKIKVQKVLCEHINGEIEGLENDIYEVDKKLNETCLLLDRLRAAALITFYDRADSKISTSHGHGTSTSSAIHPAVKPVIGKSIPRSTCAPQTFASVSGQKEALKDVPKTAHPRKKMLPTSSKHRVIVGNLSKYIPLDNRQKNDQVCLYI